MKSCPDCTATYPDDYAICPRDGAPLVASTLWQIGTVVRGKYRILAQLGEGGMATVYKAHHELLDEFRALKVIKPELASDAEFMGRFRNEAIMARKLTHPNAVRVDDLDIAEDGLPFIAMELVVGDTLKTLIQRAGALPTILVLDIASHVCDALGAAHKLGLIHRDIKPDNIVLIAQRDGPPIAKILDFGISRLREQTTGLTQTGMVIGTPEYMSPEQVLGKRCKEIDGRSDLYSLGIVMYRMLTGELPFQAETTVEMILQHLQTAPKAPHQLKPGLGIPESVSAIVMKAMEKNREKRFATGAEMAAAIKKARDGMTQAASKVEWQSLNSASASFGTEVGAAGSATSRSSTNAVRPAAVSPPAPTTEKSAYRTSARIVPARREFPMHLIWALLALILLSGGAIAAWRHFASLRPAKQYQDQGTVLPAETPALSPLGPQTKVEAAPSEPDPPVAVAPTSPEPKALSAADQAKIAELDSLAAIYYRDGGCAKALSTYQQVLEIDANDPRAHSVVQKCYSQARSRNNTGSGFIRMPARANARPAPPEPTSDQ